jgi:hypothetical protein
MYSSIITLKVEGPFSALKVTRKVGVLTTNHFWMCFCNDDLQARRMGLGWVCEFSFRLHEPHAKVFKGGGQRVFGIPQKTPKTTTIRND